MPPKSSARARKAANRQPTSLAILTPPAIKTTILIDPQLLALANAGNTLDASNPLDTGNTPTNSEGDLLANDEAFINEESQQDVQPEPEPDIN
jgi:hypothetical protein